MKYPIKFPSRYFSNLPHDDMGMFGSASCVERIEKFFNENGISLHVDGVEHGPVVTKYVVSLSKDTDHISKVENLRRDLGLRLGVGASKVFIGETAWKGGVSLAIEVPNASRVAVPPTTVIPVPDSDIAKGLRVCLGVDTSGVRFCVDLAKAPHVLVAGQSGSGKSVFLNSLICGLLDNYSYDECRVAIIDPKGTEFTPFNGHRQLFLDECSMDEPRVGLSDDAVKLLNDLVFEMKNRMKRFAQYGVSNLAQYRALPVEKTFGGLPYIVVVIDEFYDLMMNYPDTEAPLGILAAKARSTGIHLVLATQRPSVDVIRGALKANLSTRIALKVASRTDSQVIIDQPGAEALCGRGDMLYCGPDGDVPKRLHGCMVTNEQIRSFVEAIANDD